MILIADSGSTKTDWRVLHPDGKIEQAKTVGFNPYYQNEEDIYRELDQVLLPQLNTNVDKIFYYGAGCLTDEKCMLVQNAIAKAFPAAHVEVHHDLLAAARALCNREPGIACILGTGSNSCLYDGVDIVDNVPSLGFMLGDEGSGAVMGKKLIGDFLKRNLPKELEEKFEKRFKTGEAEVLENVYKKPFPNRYLAGFTKFLFDNQNHPHIYKLIYQSFEEFYERNVFKYKDHQKYPVHFIGSIAFYYSNILRQVANDKGVVVKNILESPIAGLTLYHQSSKN